VLRNFGAVPSRFNLQSKKLVGGDGVGLHSEDARVWIACPLQGKPGPGGRVFRDLDVNVARREPGRVVVQILDFDFDDANLHRVGHHLKRNNALGVLAAHYIPVDLHLRGKNPGRAEFHPARLRIGNDPQVGRLRRDLESLFECVLCHVPNHRAGLHLLIYSIFEVNDSLGADPKQEQQRNYMD
uniref:Uncharacterized protein n=1 Tax=Hippocampus comes TaxID=109280 RepID=A0A3Q2XPT6_HIPCM